MVAKRVIKPMNFSEYEAELEESYAKALESAITYVNGVLALPASRALIRADQMVRLYAREDEIDGELWTAIAPDVMPLFVSEGWVIYKYTPQPGQTILQHPTQYWFRRSPIPNHGSNLERVLPKVAE